MMKFLADMGISPASVANLRTQGFDAVHLHEQGLDRMDDRDILEKARVEGRVVLTHDLDFGDLLALSGDELPSVVIFRLKDMRSPNVNRYLAAILKQYSDLLEQGAIFSVNERRTRVRRLPIS